MIKKTDKTNRSLNLDDKNMAIRKCTGDKPFFGEKLARNMALAGMLLLAVVSVRSERLPSGQTVSAAVHQLLDPDWEEKLGRISFVSSILPESVAVFFENAPSVPLSAPCFGDISHAWTSDEPYLAYSLRDQHVFAASDGQVMSLAHGYDDGVVLRLRHEDGYETLYYGLSDVNVQEGEKVTAQTCLGCFSGSESGAFEVRRFGLPVDPSGMLKQRSPLQ